MSDRRPSRICAAALLVAVVLSLASPAGADPARPTNFSSEVTGVVPATETVTARVVGGDAFMSLKADAGHVVTVLGYESEPYLRINADGTVDENAKSPAVALNVNRYGATSPDPDADAKAAPVWRRAGKGGEVVWHDHRIHWMSTSTPPNGTAFATTWSIPLIVDGNTVTVNGTLRLLPAPNDYWIWVIVAVVLGGLAALAKRTELLAVGAAAAFAITLAVQLDTPSLVGRRWVLVALAAVALGALVAAALLRTQPQYAAALRDGSAVALVLFAWMTRTVVNHAVLVSDVAAWLQRLAFSLSVAIVIAVVAAHVPMRRKVPA